jgi:hypothetical protein
VHYRTLEIQLGAVLQAGRHQESAGTQGIDRKKAATAD